jgi:hypothetical protein
MQRVELIDERKRGPAMPPSYAPLVEPCTTYDLLQSMLTLKVGAKLAATAGEPRTVRTLPVSVQLSIRNGTSRHLHGPLG